MIKAIFILGPTAVGKTSLAVELSKKIRSQLISADSVQVFCNADIISGKDHPKDALIELIDVVSPYGSYSVADYKKDAERVIKKAVKEKKIPIIVGGTGLYSESLISNIDTLFIPRNLALRKELDKLSKEELQIKLKRLNSKKYESMNNSDVNNKRRLVRAIEVESSDGNINSAPVFKREEVLLLGLRMSMDELRLIVAKRVKARIKMGAISEAKKLYSFYESLSSQIKNANGYRELFSYLSDNTSLDLACEKWITVEYQHAKKQMTWFSRDKSIHWFDVSKKGFERDAFSLVLSSLNTP